MIYQVEIQAGSGDIPPRWSHLQQQPSIPEDGAAISETRTSDSDNLRTSLDGTTRARAVRWSGAIEGITVGPVQVAIQLAAATKQDNHQEQVHGQPRQYRHLLEYFAE